MKLKSLIVLSLLLLGLALQAQDYNVVMPGQKKVTKTDEQGNTTTQIVTDDDSDFIQYRSGSWFYKGKTMSEDEFVAKMKAECTPAYEKFMRSERVRKTGYTLFGVGGGAMVLGAAFMIWGAADADYVYTNCYGYTCERYMEMNWQLISGMCMLIAGGAVFIGGAVVTFQTAPDCKRKAHQVYNSKCAQKSETISLNWQVGSEGVGLALKF